MPIWQTVEKLGPHHRIEDFICGEASVDDWLHNSARQNAHLVSTFVCLDAEGVIRGFYAIKTVIVDVEGFASRNRGGATNGQSVGIALSDGSASIGQRERAREASSAQSDGGSRNGAFLKPCVPVRCRCGKREACFVLRSGRPHSCSKHAQTCPTHECARKGASSYLVVCRARHPRLYAYPARSGVELSLIHI